MKRLIIAAASLALIAGCVKSPTSSAPTYREPFGTMSLDIGPDVSIIVNAPRGTDVSAQVKTAFDTQQALDFEQLVDEAIDNALDINPELIEVTQTRLMYVDTVFLGRNSPGITGCPEFAPLLHEALAASGKFYNMSISQPRVDRIVTMTVDGGTEVQMRLTICDALLSHPNWIP